MPMPIAQNARADGRRRVRLGRPTSFHASLRRTSDPDASESYHVKAASAATAATATTTNTNNGRKPNRHRKAGNLSAARHSAAFLRKSTSFLKASFASGASSLEESGESATASVDEEIDPLTMSLAIQAAEEVRDGFLESLPNGLAKVLDTRDCLAPFLKDEIVLGPKLGSGEYSNVYEVSSFSFEISQKPIFDSDRTLEEMERRVHMKQHEGYRETKKARYALKHIKEEYCKEHDTESYIQATSDLAMEAELLASLNHPNIIKLRGTSQGGAQGLAQGPSGYFLVIDRLFDTLQQRLMVWRSPTSSRDKKSGFFRRASSNIDAPENAGAMMDEKFNIAFQLSAAMTYMHKNSIIFRDLKPANIGFDVRGDVKIFDFGLARVIPQGGDPLHDLYEMSGAGSPRYMAPECMAMDPYNLKADVYTFSIVLWEMLAGRTPYVFAKSRSQLAKYVVKDNGRPFIEDSWPGPIQGMLESSFDADIDNRPSMELWYKIIRQVLASLRGGNKMGLSDSHVNRRRSMDSLRNITKDL